MIVALITHYVLYTDLPASKGEKLKNLEVHVHSNKPGDYVKN